MDIRPTIQNLTRTQVFDMLEFLARTGFPPTTSEEDARQLWQELQEHYSRLLGSLDWLRDQALPREE